MTKKVNLGDEVLDTTSGFKGLAVGRAEFLAGCVRVLIQPKVGKDGKMTEGVWIDEGLCKVTKPVAKPKEEKVPTGGPRDDANRTQDAVR